MAHPPPNGGLDGPLLWSIRRNVRSGAFVAHCSALGLIVEGGNLGELTEAARRAISMMARDMRDRADGLERAQHSFRAA